MVQYVPGVASPLHDDEAPTGRALARGLLRAQVPGLAGLPLKPLRGTGSDNALYRLGTHLVVRLPRFPDAARRLGVELDWLPRLGVLPVAVPEVVHTGVPGEHYPFRWAVLGWIDGLDAWAARHRRGWFGADLGRDLASVLHHLRQLPVAGAPARGPGERGGPLRALDERMRWWLDQAGTLVDATAVLRLWEQCREAADHEGDPVLLHGDLIPGNLLVAGGRLTSVIDWGGLGAGDPAQDVVPAWAVLDRAGATAFRAELGVDDETWLRARGFALEQAVGGVVHHAPRGHPLGAVMQRTLACLLSGR